MTNDNERIVTPQELANLGGGAIAYVTAVLSEDAGRMFPQAQNLKPGVRLFALLAADGTPILLTDNKDVAIANAWEHQLQTVSVH